MYNESGITKVGKTRQWAKGQVLSLVGFPNLPASFEMYFQNADGTPINAQGQIGTNSQVSIPDTFFANGSNINAWMWLPTSEDEGKYIYKFVFPIERCPRPADYTYTQEQESLVDQAIAALNDAVAQTGQSVTDAENAATLSESWAVGGTGTREGEGTDNAKYYAEQSAGSAESAENSATSASDSASAASDSADDAKDYATNASDSAEAASQSATAAQESADSAEQSAERAEQAAATAGYLDMYINDEGYLVYERTPQVSVDFEIDENGYLVMGAS